MKILVNSVNEKQVKDSLRAECTGCLLATTSSYTLLIGLKITKFDDSSRTFYDNCTSPFILY